MFISIGIKNFCYAFSFLLLMMWQGNTYAADSTDIGPLKRRPPPLHSYVLDFGFKRIKVSNGALLASTARSCEPGYQLRYLVSLVETEDNKGILEVSNIYLQTCLAANKNIFVNKKANVNYFGPFTGTGNVKVSYWFMCEPCKDCVAVDANC